jgi:hypothetical protein
MALEGIAKLAGFETIAENRIREAMERGDFDRLPGSGKPIDLDEYFRAPGELRMAYAILKSAGCLPEEVELLNEIAALERAAAAAPPEGGSGNRARQTPSRALARARLRLDLARERARRR